MIGKNIIFPIGNIPVKLSGIVTPNKSPTSNVCLECKKGSVGHKNYCKSCGIFNTSDQIGSGLLENGQMKVFTKDQMEEIKTMTKNIVVKSLVSIDQVDFRLKNDNGYYIMPSKEDENKLYQKIFNALKATRQAIVATWKYNTNVTRDRLCVLIPLEDCLVLYQLNYHEELNEIPEAIDLKLTKEETIEGIALINTVKKGSIADIVDQYQIDLENLLSGKPNAISIPKKTGLSFSPEQIAQASKAFAESQVESELTESKSKQKRGKKSN